MQLTASIAFTSVALFNVLRFPLNMLPNVITSLVDCNISIKRIEKYLLADDRDEAMIEWKRDSDEREPAGSVGSCSWFVACTDST